MAKEIYRRTFLKAGIGLGGGAALGLLGVGTYEPHELTVEHVEILLARLPVAFDGFRLVQLSDIHFGEYMTKSHLQQIVAVTNTQQPDLVVLTGDFVTAPLLHGGYDRAAQQAWPCAELLRGLRARFGRVAILGNHDCGTNPRVVTEALTANGCRVLRNRSMPFEAERARLWLAGVDDVMERYADPHATLRRVPPDECVVAAVHEPDFADEMRKYPVDLQISGHSHGGQVRIPGVGALYLPKWAKKYPLGYYRVGGLQLYTNRGVGVIRLPVRFMCPPEITVFTLRSDLGPAADNH